MTLTFTSAIQPSAPSATYPVVSILNMWSQLPTELWLDILEEFSQKDLSALNRSCKSLHQLTEPLLYSKLSWVPEMKRSFLSTSRPDPFIYKSSIRIHLLLRTLLNRPELAYHIKVAEVMSPISTTGDLKNILSLWAPGTKGTSGFTEREYELAEMIIREMDFFLQDEWLEGLWRGRSDIIIALLLSRLSEISSLDIRLRTIHYQPPIIGGTILEVLRSRSLKDESPLHKKLKSITLSIDRDERGFQTCQGRMAHLYRFDRQVAPLFDTSVEGLGLAWVCPGSPMRPSAVPIARNLTTLIIRDSVIDEHVLGILLRGTQQLETLECELTYDPVRNEHCDCQFLRSALDWVSTTLKTLVISIRITCHGRLPTDREIILGSMGSMIHFQELRYGLTNLLKSMGFADSY